MEAGLNAKEEESGGERRRAEENRETSQDCNSTGHQAIIHLLRNL
jgi:hypothetical protein